MGFNLFFDIAAIVILTFLVFSIVLKRQFIGLSNKFYLLVIIITSIAAALDILASIDSFSLNALFILNTFFVLFRAGIATSLFFYTLNLARVNQRLRKVRWVYILLFIPLMILVVCLIVNFSNKMIFDYLAGPKYQRGDFMWIAYAVGGSYIGASFVVIIVTRKYYLKTQVIAMFVAYLSQISASVFQYYVGDVLVEMFMTAITLSLLSLFIESPENFIDFKTQTLNYRSFSSDMQQQLDIKVPFDVLFIKVTNASIIYNLYPYKKAVIFNRACSANVIEKAKKIDKSATVYFLGNTTFAYVFNKREIEKEMVELVHKEFASPMENNGVSFQFVAKTCLVNCPEDCNNIHDLVAFSNTFFDLTESNHLDVRPYRKEHGNLLFELDHILQKAINNKSFSIHYQGIYSLKENKFIAAEALLRLKDPNFGMIMPSLMIPYSEVRSKSIGIGRVVIEKSFEFFSAHLRNKLQYIEINLSPAQVSDSNLVKDIETLAEKYQIEPKEIVFEITETISETEDPNVQTNIKLLQEMGYRIAIDDFGTGYSNLSRIMHLDISILKFDRTMTQLLEKDGYEDFFRGLLPIFRKRKILVLFEGVETKEVVDKLEAMKVDHIQGYYYSMTLPENEFLELLEISKAE